MPCTPREKEGGNLSAFSTNLSFYKLLPKGKGKGLLPWPGRAEAGGIPRKNAIRGGGNTGGTGSPFFLR